MPSFLAFYNGAITRSDFWQLTQAEFNALYSYAVEQTKQSNKPPQKPLKPNQYALDDLPANF